jgi:hypothetical protein
MAKKKKTTWKEGRFILAYNFRDFSPLSLGSIVGSVVRQSIMAERTWQSKAA